MSNSDQGSHQDRYTYIAPMVQPDSDDTEAGIPVTSAIVEQSKKRTAILTADEELRAAPLLYSNINRIAKQRSTQLPPPVPNTVQWRQPDPTDPTEEEPTVLISFQSNVPLGGKTSFTVAHRMSQPVSVLRRQLIDDVQRIASSSTTARNAPTGPVTLHRSDTGEELPTALTLLQLGFRFPPLLRVHNYHREMYLVCAAPLAIRMPLSWSPSMTLSQLVEQVHKRLAPRDLRLVRLSVAISRSAATTTAPQLAIGQHSHHATNVDEGEDEVRVVSTQYLDIHRCYVPAPPRSLPPTETLQGLRYCTAIEDPVCITLLRPKDGAPWFYSIPFTGQWSVQDVSEYIATLCDGSGSGDGEASLSDYLVPHQPLLDAFSLAGGPSAPFDDDDEEIYFEGRDGLFPTASSNDGATDGRREHRGLFAWTVSEVQQVYGDQYASSCGGPVVSFCPPPKACVDARPPLRFVSIEEDFLIPHLSDLGIFPGDEVLVEFLDPMTQRWSGELSTAVARLLPSTSRPSSSAMEGQQHRQHNNSSSNNSKVLSPLHELITVRLTSSTAIIRIPCTPTTTAESVLWMVFMATGNIPMLGELLTDNGRVLAPFESMASANLLPQTTLFLTHRRRQWLKEPLPNLATIDVLQNAQRLYSGVAAPTL